MAILSSELLMIETTGLNDTERQYLVVNGKVTDTFTRSEPRPKPPPKTPEQLGAERLLRLNRIVGYTLHSLGKVIGMTLLIAAFLVISWSPLWFVFQMRLGPEAQFWWFISVVVLGPVICGSIVFAIDNAVDKTRQRHIQDAYRDRETVPQPRPGRRS